MQAINAKYPFTTGTLFRGIFLPLSAFHPKTKVRKCQSIRTFTYFDFGERRHTNPRIYAPLRRIKTASRRTRRLLLA